MPKCICCGAEVSNLRPTDLCDWCGSQLPGGIPMLARGDIGEFNCSETRHIWYQGIWNKSNWMEYPSLKKRREEVRDICVVEDCYEAQDKESKYPHVCPKCGSPAYIGLTNLDCSGGCK